MLSRGSSNLEESNQKLQEIQRQLRIRLEKAKEIVSSCSSLDDVPLKTQDEVFSELEQVEIPPFDPQVNYNHSYWKIYLDNQYNLALIREASEKKKQLNELISQIEDLQDQHYRLNRLKNRKKNRRLATEIEKSYLCPYDKCRRVYGSDVSLNLHIKLKHNGGNKTDREKLAEKICMAEQENAPAPQMTLNLPPGYLRVHFHFIQEYRRLYFQREYPQPEGQSTPPVSLKIEQSEGYLLQDNDPSPSE